MTDCPIVLTLPPDFSFSQSNLQTFADCPRRFYLAHVQRLPWPAVEAAPAREHERLLRMGALFHRLVERAYLGITPATQIDALAEPLRGWMHAFQQYRPQNLPSDTISTESTLSIPFALDASNSVRIAAKFDLIAAQPGRAVIVDWKTGRNRIPLAALRQRWQSVIYPYVLVEASADLPWGPVSPDAVEMRYWYAGSPDTPAVLRYSADAHAAAHEQIRAMLCSILGRAGEEEFPKVPDTPENRKRFCDFCVYRTRCERGEQPGLVTDLERDFDDESLTPLTISLDDVGELAF